MRAAVRGLLTTRPPAGVARAHASRLMCSAASGVASMLTAVLKPLGAGYAITCAIALVAQRKLQYFPSSERPTHPGAINPLFADIQEVEFVAADGTRCLGWHWPAPPATMGPVLPWWLPGGDGALPSLKRAVAGLRRERLQQMDVVLFHGNAGDRSHRLGWMHLVREGLGCSVTVLDYRGYGGSEGSPTERGFYQDGAAAVAWVRERQRPGRKLVLWGESIGTGVALSLAAQAQAVVVEGGFSSAVDLGATAYPWLPVRWFMLDKFVNTRWAEALPQVTPSRTFFPHAGRARSLTTRSRPLTAPQELPVLMVHGALDDIAPIHLSRRLLAAWEELSTAWRPRAKPAIRVCLKARPRGAFC